MLPRNQGTYTSYIRAGFSFVDYVWAVVRMIVCVGLLWVGRLFGYKLVGCVSCFVRWAVWWAVGRMCGCHIIRFSLFICECCGPGAFGLFWSKQWLIRWAAAVWFKLIGWIYWIFWVGRSFGSIGGFRRHLIFVWATKVCLGPWDIGFGLVLLPKYWTTLDGYKIGMVMWNTLEIKFISGAFL